MTTLYRIGSTVFSLAHVQSVNLNYDPKRYDKNKPPSCEPGVEVVLISGERLKPFFGAEAAVLRDFLMGRDVARFSTYVHHDGLTIHELIPRPVETADAPEPEPARDPLVGFKWEVDDQGRRRRVAFNLS